LASYAITVINVKSGTGRGNRQASIFEIPLSWPTLNDFDDTTSIY